MLLTWTLTPDWVSTVPADAYLDGLPMTMFHWEEWDAYFERFPELAAHHGIARERAERVVGDAAVSQQGAVETPIAGSPAVKSDDTSTPGEPEHKPTAIKEPTPVGKTEEPSPAGMVIDG
ncbi:hypothetical protein DL93DRAFT_2164500 [Clavulina sp. PMI_390]|nr:hypothetical protein DL93DRAFT_2164500 [Clavulina sp. PMI_390]